MTNEEIKEKLEELSKGSDKNCPHCGRCPTCGRRLSEPVPCDPPWEPVPCWPLNPGYPYWPYGPILTWTSDSTSATEYVYKIK